MTAYGFAKDRKYDNVIELLDAAMQKNIKGFVFVRYCYY